MGRFSDFKTKHGKYINSSALFASIDPENKLEFEYEWDDIYYAMKEVYKYDCHKALKANNREGSVTRNVDKSIMEVQNVRD